MKYYAAYNELIDPDSTTLRNLDFQVVGSGYFEDKIITFNSLEDKVVMNLEQFNSGKAPFILFRFDDEQESNLDLIENIELKNKSYEYLIYNDYDTNSKQIVKAIVYTFKESLSHKTPTLELTKKLQNAYCLYNIPISLLDDYIRFCKTK